MQKRSRPISIHVTFNSEEHERIAEIHTISGSEARLTEYCRKLLLGEVKHPLMEPEQTQGINVENSGPLEGPWDNHVYYHSMVVAAMYLKILNDPEFRKVIQANRSDFELIMRHIRGYNYDDKLAQKRPL